MDLKIVLKLAYFNKYLIKKNLFLSKLNFNIEV